VFLLLFFSELGPELLFLLQGLLVETQVMLRLLSLSVGPG